MIEKISIHNLLPQVFEDMQNTPQIRESRIWDVADYAFERGCRICLQADSGSGKTSLLSFIYGIRQDYLGKICFDGVDVRSFGIDHWCQIRQRGIALLPQQLGLFAELTTLENIDIKNSLTHCKTPQQIKDLLERLGLAEKIDSPVGKLSVGQQQRVAFIRALCQPFDFIFLDEPVSHLDASNNRLIAEILEEECVASGAGIVSTSVGNQLKLSDATIVKL